MDCVDSMYIYVGRMVPPETLQELFEVTSVNNENVPKHFSEGSDLGHRLAAIIKELRRGRMVYGPVKLIFQGHPFTVNDESEFLALLVDDNTPHEVSYVDFLCAIHRKIQNELI